MAHGGSRPRSGPAPDPNAMRRDRPSDAASWTTIYPRTDPAPEWPLTVPASPSEVLHWEQLWALPQATQWELEGGATVREVAFYVRVAAQAELPVAKGNILTEEARRASALGLTSDSALKRRWKVAPSATEDPTAATATTKPPAARSKRGPSSRDRFRVVATVEEE